MSILNVSTIEGVKWNFDQISLRQPSNNVKKELFGTDILKFIISDMFETLYSTPCGVGLAAPQVGIQIKIIVVDLKRNVKKPEVFINPHYEPLSDLKKSGIESCLSVPGKKGTVERYESIKATYQDFYGNTIEKEMHGFEAKVFQHETDHLDGILYIDRISNPELIVDDGGLLKPKAEQAIHNLLDISE